MKQYKVQFSSTAFDPHIALDSLDLAIRSLDTQVAIHNPNGTIINDDLPIIIHGKTGDGQELCGFRMEIYNSDVDSNNIHNEPNSIPTPKFSIGESVIHIDSGIEQIVQAKIYYHGIRQHYYLTSFVNSKGNPAHNQYPESHLMSGHDFDELNQALNAATGKTWFMDESISMFVCMSNKARKMRMSDARHAITTHVSGEEAPF